MTIGILCRTWTIALYRKFETYFLRMKLRGLIPHFHIHLSVSDLYITKIGPRHTNHGNI
jgi:hypothetical protein